MKSEKENYILCNIKKTNCQQKKWTTAYAIHKTLLVRSTHFTMMMHISIMYVPFLGSLQDKTGYYDDEHTYYIK